MVYAPLFPKICCHQPSFFPCSPKSHFRVAACLSFKASPGAQPFKWKQEARLSLNSGLGKVNVVVKEEGRDLFVFLDKICIVFVMTLECVCRE